MQTKVLLSLVAVFSFALAEAVAQVFRYTDDSGRVHYVGSIEQVPSRYRNQVKGEADLPRITRVPAGVFTPRSTVSQPATKIEIFVTDGCPHCRRLEQYLEQRNVRYKRVDIEKDAAGERRFRELGGRGVPIIKIGSTIINGFNPEALESELARMKR